MLVHRRLSLFALFAPFAYGTVGCTAVTGISKYEENVGDTSH